MSLPLPPNWTEADDKKSPASQEWYEPMEKQYTPEETPTSSLRPRSFGRRSGSSSGVRIKNVENVALATATERSRPSLFSTHMLKLYRAIAIASLISCGNGYIGTMMGAINNLPQYRSFFGFDPQTGTPYNSIVLAIFPIGTLVSSLFISAAADIKGRKFGMGLGCALTVIGAIIQATSNGFTQFVIARFILGFGISLAQGCGIVYVSEIAHPSYRGPMTGIFNTFWYVGCMPAAFIPDATSGMDNDQSWRIPLYSEGVIPFVMVSLLWLCPESPRWLIANNRQNEAFDIMTKYHGGGNANSPIVQLEYKEIIESISTDGVDKRPFHFIALFNSKEVRYRSMLVFSFAIISQWTGNGAISYFYPTMLNGAGIKAHSQINLLTGIQILVSYVGSLLGAIFTDKVGRRRQVIFGTIGIIIIFTIVTALSATNIAYDAAGDTSVRNGAQAKATICMFFLFGFVYSAGYTALQELYPVECMSFELRAKGVGLYMFGVSCALFYVQMVTEIAFTHAHWKYYFLFIFWNCATVAFMYRYFVETRNRTLEEMSEIFRAQYPVRTSLMRGKIIIKGENIVVHTVDRVVD